MNCKDVREWIPLGVGDDFDGDTTPYEEHLADCDTCAQEFDAYESNLMSLSMLREAPEPDGLYEAMWRNVQAGIEQGSTSRFRLIPGGFAFRVAAAVLLGVLAGFAGVYLAGDDTNSVDPENRMASFPEEEFSPVSTRAVDSSSETKTVRINPRQFPMIQITEKISVKRDPVGVQLLPIHPAISAQFPNLKGRGALVSRVSAGSAAATAGLQKYDIVIAVDGADFESPSDLREQLGKAAGSSLTLHIIRGGETIQRTLTLPNER